MNTAQSYEIETLSLFDSPNETGSPERRLLLAILERAILDFVGNEPREVAGSSDWIFGDNSDDDDADNDEQFSFNWVCLQLDLDAGHIAEQIRQMPKRGSHRIAPWYLTKSYGEKFGVATNRDDIG